MIKANKILVVCLSLILMSAMIFIPPASARDVEGKTFYTTANIWYEHPEKIYSTNYHRGTILPAGTKVTVTDVSRKAIKFEEADGIPYRILYVKKHNRRGSDVWEHFDRYFSEKNPKSSGAYKKFTKKEKDNIEFGEITEGMSKEAVLMSYGYPPSHRTPSIKGNSWIYWINRFVNKRVNFKNNKVVSISR